MKPREFNVQLKVSVDEDGHVAWVAMDEDGHLATQGRTPTLALEGLHNLITARIWYGEKHPDKLSDPFKFIEDQPSEPFSFIDEGNSD